MKAKTKAVRLYGKGDLRLEEFVLSDLQADEILVQIMATRISMPTYEMVEQGAEHPLVPADCDKNPPIIGHAFCGMILEVGKKWKSQYQPLDKITVDPALGDGSSTVAGYSLPFFGGASKYAVVPNSFLEGGNIINHKKIRADGNYFGDARCDGRDGKQADPTTVPTHIGGLDSVIPSVLELSCCKDAVKVVYPHLSMPMTAIADFEALGEKDPMYAELARLCKENGGKWNTQAEKYLLENCKKI